MVDQWDRFAASANQTIDALGFDSNVDVFQPTESFTQGEGYDISYPDSPTATVDGMVEPPSASGDEDRGGTTRDADLLVYVAADTTVEFTDSGESGEALTRLEVDGTPETYEVVTTEPQFDGLLLLECVET